MLPKFRLSENRAAALLHYVDSVMELICHFVGTTTIFLSLVILVWGASWTFAFLHSVYPFSGSVFKIFTNFELYLIYADLIVSAVAILIGAFRIIRRGLEATK